MKIAIIGSGFAGLAVAWHLAKRNNHVTVFDKRGLDGGASRTAAGLIHPFRGKRPTYAPHGIEAFQEVLSLFKESAPFQEDDAILHRGLVRLALSLDQESAFRKGAKENPKLHWFEKHETKNYHKDLAPFPGLFVEEALTIEPNLYLNALIKGLVGFGAEFIEKNVESLDELKHFDAVVIASGYETLQFKEVKDLPFGYLKGQGLEFLLPEDMEPLEYAVTSDIYVVMMKDRKRFFAGATFEREVSDPLPDLQIAKDRILPRLIHLFPRLKGIEPLAVRSNVRLTASGYFPIAKQIGPSLWVFSGLGSKGLLYHALLGKKLAEEISYNKY